MCVCVCVLWGGFDLKYGVTSGMLVSVSVPADPKADTVMMTTGRMQLPAGVLINTASKIRCTDYVNSE